MVPILFLSLVASFSQGLSIDGVSRFDDPRSTFLEIAERARAYANGYADRGSIGLEFDKESDQMYYVSERPLEKHTLLFRVPMSMLISLPNVTQSERRQRAYHTEHHHFSRDKGFGSYAHYAACLLKNASSASRLHPALRMWPRECSDGGTLLPLFRRHFPAGSYEKVLGAMQEDQAKYEMFRAAVPSCDVSSHEFRWALCNIRNRSFKATAQRETFWTLLVPLGDLFDHAVSPNVRYRQRTYEDQDYMLFFTRRDIQQGERLTISYFSSCRYSPLDIMSRYGFYPRNECFSVWINHKVLLKRRHSDQFHYGFYADETDLDWADPEQVRVLHTLCSQEAKKYDPALRIANAFLDRYYHESRQFIDECVSRTEATLNAHEEL